MQQTSSESAHSLWECPGIREEASARGMQAAHRWQTLEWGCLARISPWVHHYNTLAFIPANYFSPPRWFHVTHVHSHHGSLIHRTKIPWSFFNSTRKKIASDTFSENSTRCPRDYLKSFPFSCFKPKTESHLSSLVIHHRFLTIKGSSWAATKFPD